MLEGWRPNQHREALTSPLTFLHPSRAGAETFHAQRPHGLVTRGGAFATGCGGGDVGIPADSGLHEKNWNADRKRR
jgi:hypothetical protein